MFDFLSEKRQKLFHVLIILICIIPSELSPPEFLLKATNSIIIIIHGRDLVAATDMVVIGEYRCICLQGTVVIDIIDQIHNARVELCYDENQRR